MKNDKVYIVCYGECTYWNSRKNALDFFRTGVEICEGCEQDRYKNICLDLAAGYIFCCDDYSRNLTKKEIEPYKQNARHCFQEKQ